MRVNFAGSGLWRASAFKNLTLANWTSPVQARGDRSIVFRLSTTLTFRSLGFLNRGAELNYRRIEGLLDQHDVLQECGAVAQTRCECWPSDDPPVAVNRVAADSAD